MTPDRQPRPRPESGTGTDTNAGSSSPLFKLLWGLTATGIFLGGVGLFILAIVSVLYAPDVVAELPRLTEAIYELAESMEGIQMDNSDDYTYPTDPHRSVAEHDFDFDTPEVSIIKGADGRPTLVIRQESSDANYTVRARLFDDYLPHLMNEFAQYIHEHGVEE